METSAGPHFLVRTEVFLSPVIGHVIVLLSYHTDPNNYTWMLMATSQRKVFCIFVHLTSPTEEGSPYKGTLSPGSVSMAQRLDSAGVVLLPDPSG